MNICVVATDGTFATSLPLYEAIEATRAFLADLAADSDCFWDAFELMYRGSCWRCRAGSFCLKYRAIAEGRMLVDRCHDLF